MNQQRFMIAAGAAAVLLAAGVWLSVHRSNQQSNVGGEEVFADLKPALGQVEEIRFAKGDGSRTTLRKSGNGWIVVERQYPADAGRVRELALALANLKVVERKTSEPANYPTLGVEAPDKPTAASTLLEVVAGKKTWALIVGKGAGGRGVYVRKPTEAASSLATPLISADPDQKRWIDRLLTDIPGASVHQIAVKPSSGPAYLLTREDRGAADLTLSPVPRGRSPGSSMSLNAQADALTAFNFDEVRAQPATKVAPSDTATYRTFDGQVIEFAGHREGEKTYVTVAAHRDAALAAKFPQPAPAPVAAVTPAAADKAAPASAAATPQAATPAAAKPADQTAERLASRAKGVEYEVPAYKYEALFKKQEELLEKAPESAK